MHTSWSYWFGSFLPCYFFRFAMIPRFFRSFQTTSSMWFRPFSSPSAPSITMLRQLTGVYLMYFRSIKDDFLLLYPLCVQLHPLFQHIFNFVWLHIYLDVFWQLVLHRIQIFLHSSVDDCLPFQFVLSLHVIRRPCCHCPYKVQSISCINCQFVIIYSGMVITFSLLPLQHCYMWLHRVAIS